MLTVKNLKHKYRFGALSYSDVSFSIEKKEVFCIYGAEESGKSSLCKTICGLLAPIEGCVFFHGRDITFAPPQERNFVLLHEDGGFFENKTVWYNLAYPLIIRKFDEDTIKARIEVLSKEFHLTDSLLNKKSKVLLPEERLAVSFARLFVRDANLYVLDDPFKMIQGRNFFFNHYYPYIKKLSEKSPVIYATSDFNDIVFLDGKTLILNYGVVQQNDTISNVRNNPSSVFVNKLLYPGTIVLPGIIIQKKEKIFLACQGKEYLLDNKYLINDIYIGSEILVCVNDEECIGLYDRENERRIYFSSIV